MRVNLRRRSGEEDGVIALLVALFSSVAIACCAFTLDLGNAWQAQRQLHTATDAAALAAAQVYAGHGNGCSSIASAFVASNDPGAATAACLTGSGRAPASGFVTVQAAKSVAFRFAGARSAGEGSSTSADWGIPASAPGLRPIAVCQQFPALATWLNAPVGPTAPSGPVTMPFTKGNLGCNNAPGNWSFLDYDGASGGGANDLSDWLANGFPGTVAFPSLIPPQTGHVSSVANDLSRLVTSREIFPITVFDLITGNGNNARYHATAVVLVRLVAFRVTGSPSQQSMTFEFQPGIIHGSCCGTGPDTGARVVAICAVNEVPTASECGR